MRSLLIVGFLVFCFVAWVWPDFVVGAPPQDYYKVTFVSAIDLVFKVLLALYFSNYFAEKNSKNGKKIDASVKLIENLSEILNSLQEDFKAECTNDGTKKRILSGLKAIDNYLDIAEKEKVAPNYISELKAKREELYVIADSIHQEKLSCREISKFDQLISESNTYLSRAKFDLFK